MQLDGFSGARDAVNGFSRDVWAFEWSRDAIDGFQNGHVMLFEWLIPMVPERKYFDHSTSEKIKKNYLRQLDRLNPVQVYQYKKLNNNISIVFLRCIVFLRLLESVSLENANYIFVTRNAHDAQ